MKIWLGVYAEDGNGYEVEKDIERVEDEKRLSSTLSTALVPSLAFIDIPYM